MEILHVLAQQQEHVLAPCKEQADASSKTEDFEGRYKLQVFHSLFGITVRAAKSTCKTLIVNTELTSVSDLMQQYLSIYLQCEGNGITVGENKCPN